MWALQQTVNLIGLDARHSINFQMQSIIAMTDYSIASIVSIGSVEEAEEHPLKSIILLSCAGLIASLCLMAFGIDVSAGWV